MTNIQVPFSVEVPIDDLVSTVQEKAREAIESQTDAIVEIVRRRSKAILSTELDSTIKRTLHDTVARAVDGVLNMEEVRKAVRAEMKAAIKEAVAEATKSGSTNA